MRRCKMLGKHMLETPEEEDGLSRARVVRLSQYQRGSLELTTYCCAPRAEYQGAVFVEP